MGPRTDAADARRDPGHLLDGPSDAEPLEAPQFDRLEHRVLNVTCVIKLDDDLSMSFETRHRRDR